MQWNKVTLKEARLKAKLSQTALAELVGVHWRTVQNWEKGCAIPQATLLALDKVLCDADQQNSVPREEYNRVIAALDSATELNRKLTDIIQSSLQNTKE